MVFQKKIICTHDVTEKLLLSLKLKKIWMHSLIKIQKTFILFRCYSYRSFKIGSLSVMDPSLLLEIYVLRIYYLLCIKFKKKLYILPLKTKSNAMELG